MVGIRLKRRAGLSRVAGYIRNDKMEVKILIDAQGRAHRLCRLRGEQTFHIVGQDGKMSWPGAAEAPCAAAPAA